ncbi:hypothetical protein BHF71_10520 [Vulcanibacillus modesticaldus]|uniref:Peptidase S51 n=1 Tax=Vulcanibacillus modesticaldus TaxID=337097 RepID=A0A1D2YTC7_9BACI|nr:cyanophycinase [Vulcanibacillus modesticaldus]OEF98952.1 hypothetical protein BHF71_10520 [Vulcanibacillus modesticaldus]
MNVNTDKFLFLIGGNPSIDEVAEQFISRAGGSNAIIALLLLYREGWEEYLPRYVDPWIKRNIKKYYVIMPDQIGRLDNESVINKLRKATGIFIGGGNTLLYNAYYSSEPIRNIIHERYNNGVPIAGNSAGALIMPKICLVSPNDTDDGFMRIEEGLGLFNNMLVSVHLSKWNDSSNLVEGMIKTKTEIGWGIDDNACLVLKNGDFNNVIGESVYKIKIEDFELQTYDITTIK